MNPILLALDFGGTKLAAATWRREGAEGKGFTRVASVLSPPTNDATADREVMLEICDEVLAGEAPAAVGVSFGGLVQHKQGKVVRSHHVRGWEGFPLQEWLESCFKVPVVVDNDANVAAFGEWRFGAGKGSETLLYVTVSTGVGGGWILGGQIHHGRDGLAGEIGHMSILKDGPLCTCGRRGCVEALSSGQAIARRASEIMTAQPAIETPLRTILSRNTIALTAKEVAEAAAAGDKVAIRVLREAAEFLGRGIACAISLMNPDRVILGGGVTKAGAQYLKWVRDTVRLSLLRDFTAEIVSAALGDEAPLWGAIALAEAALK